MNRGLTGDHAFSEKTDGNPCALHTVRLPTLGAAGVRTMLNPLTAIGAGVGFGLDSDSPDFQAMLGLQRSF